MVLSGNWARIRQIERGIPATGYQGRRAARPAWRAVDGPRLRAGRRREQRRRLGRVFRASFARRSAHLLGALGALAAPLLMATGPLGVLGGGLLALLSAVALADWWSWRRRCRRARDLLAAAGTDR